MKCILYCDQVYTHTYIHVLYIHNYVIFLKFHKPYQGAMQNALIYLSILFYFILKKFVSTHQISLDHTF